MVDLIPRSDGEFTLLTSDGGLFDLVNTGPSSRRWVAVETPFHPVKLATRSDNHIFALDDVGNLWQRIPGLRGLDAWRQIARAPA